MNNRKIANRLSIAGLGIALLAFPAHAENMIPAVGDSPAPYANVPVPGGAPTQTETVTTTTHSYVQPAEQPIASPQPQSQPVYVWQPGPPDAAHAPPSPSADAHIPQTVSMATGATGVTSLPQPVQAGNVRYITGGVGDEERDALEAAKKDYNLHITTVNTSGEFLEDTQVTITNRQGEEVLKTPAGPMLYVDLPAGAYTVEATSGGETKKQHVTVGPHKSASVYLRW